MGKKSTPSPPPAPDPNAVSAAQTKSNQQTALYNFGLNNPNYNTPLGSLSYTQTAGQPTYDTPAYEKALKAWQAAGGSNATPMSITDWRAKGGGSGADYQKYLDSFATKNSAMPKLTDFMLTDDTNPQYTANVTLSPEQQQLYDLATGQSIDLAKLASALQGNVANSLSQPGTTPADINRLSQEAQDAYYAKQAAYLDPQFEKSQNRLENQLANQGIMRGSEAYTTAIDDFSRGKNAAYEQARHGAILAGPQNAQALFGLSTAARQQPLTEFNALRTGAQPSMPQFQGTTPAMAQPTNVSGNIWNAFGAQQDAYNQQMAAQNSMTSGLFGLGGSLGAAALMAPSGGWLSTALAASDVRLKENIVHVGYENGFPIYHFNYREDPGKKRYRGVMAQDVIQRRPDAVFDNGEYMAVNYAMIGVEFGRVH